MKKHDVGISFRVPRKLRDDAVSVAAARGERLSDVLRKTLEEYVKSKRKFRSES